LESGGKLSEGTSFVSGLESGSVDKLLKLNHTKTPKSHLVLKKKHTFASSFNVNFQLFLKFCQKIVGRWETYPHVFVYIFVILGHYFVQTHISDIPVCTPCILI
jgi:hypothetical protein